MSNDGVTRVTNLIWDNKNKTWIREPLSTDGMQTVQISGVTPAGGRLPVNADTSDWSSLIGSDDLVTEIQYNESATRTTVSGVTYSSAALGTTMLETFVSGINTLTITRS